MFTVQDPKAVEQTIYYHYPVKNVGTAADVTLRLIVDGLLAYGDTDEVKLTVTPCLGKCPSKSCYWTIRDSVPISSLIRYEFNLLSLHDAIRIKHFIWVNPASGLDDSYIAQNSGLLVWTPEEYATLQSRLDATYENAPLKVEATTLSEEYASRHLFWAHSAPVYARCYTDTVYVRGYLRFENGNYAYTDLVACDVQSYCDYVLRYGGSTYQEDEQERWVTYELLQYGAAAQKFKAYKLDDLADANVASILEARPLLTEEEIAALPRRTVE